MSCIHPLEHLLYHIQSFKARESTFSYTFLTLWSLNLSEWPKMTPLEPQPSPKNPPIAGQRVKIFKFRKKGVKEHKICYQNHQKKIFRPRPPPTPLMAWCQRHSQFCIVQLQRKNCKKSYNSPANFSKVMKIG